MKKIDELKGEKICVLIMDHHAMVRQGLRTLLELHGRSAELPIEAIRKFIEKNLHPRQRSIGEFHENLDGLC